MSSFLDMKTLIHMGIELIIIGGIAFYLNRKINATDLQIAVQKERIDALETLVKQQKSIIEKHNVVLQQILDHLRTQPVSVPSERRGLGATKAVTSKRASAPQPKAKATRPPRDENFERRVDEAVHHAVVAGIEAHQSVRGAKVQEVDDESEPVEEVDLDALLEQELSSMNTSQQSSTGVETSPIEDEDDGDGIEIECEGDVCVVKDKGASQSKTDLLKTSKAAVSTPKAVPKSVVTSNVAAKKKNTIAKHA